MPDVTDLHPRLLAEVERYERLAENTPFAPLAKAIRVAVEQHTPVLANVEWWDDRTGKGKTLVCSLCWPEDPCPEVVALATALGIGGAT